MTESSDQKRLEDRIAVVGMAGRFPGAASVGELWDVIRQGRETITVLSREELEMAGVPPALLDDPSFVPAHGALEGLDRFDAEFFGYTPREALFMDPQQRLLLECAWEVLEDAGHEAQSFGGRIGVFAGSRWSTYLHGALIPSGIPLTPEDGLLLRSTNDRDFLTSRISYLLGLTGPSVVVQTACSTSLSAVHLASQSLLDFECDLALAGGAAITLPSARGYLYQEDGIRSPNGQCRAFDAQAQGCVGADGVGLVALRRLDDAVANGDHIRAVILGSGLSNDGSDRVGFTAPGVSGQMKAITDALTQAEIDPRTVGYVEAHGTGTPLGDPIEVEALTRAFRQWTEDRGFCAIGSLKANLGHMDAAAGVGGLIKAVLTLEGKLLPPSVNFDSPNPKLALESSPFYVSGSPQPWPASATPRRAGVSSIGMGGSNVHVVLEEALQPESSTASHPVLLFPLSARSASGLDARRRRLGDHLHTHQELSAPDIAFTLQLGRKHFKHRSLVVARDLPELLTQLDQASENPAGTRALIQGEAPVAFLLPGQGSQHPRMTHGLYATQPIYRRAVDHCAQVLESEHDIDLRRALFPGNEKERESAIELQQPWLSQPAIFVVEHSLGALWKEWGVEPTALVGHSVGEIAAACLAGIFSLEDGLKAVVERGRIVQSLPAGSMATIHTTETLLREMLTSDLSVAAHNGPDLWTVSGSPKSVSALQAQAKEKNIPCIRLSSNRAFHSPSMKDAAEALLEVFEDIELKRPERQLMSTVTGRWLTDDEARDPTYWARQLLLPVLFGEAVGRVAAELDGPFLEVGPGTALTQLARRIVGGRRRARVLSSLPAASAGGDEIHHAMRTLGKLWLAGVKINWTGLHRHDKRRRVSLPTYPFERTRHWPSPPNGPRVETPSDVHTRLPLEDWFSTRQWRDDPLPSSSDGKALVPGPILIFLDGSGIGQELAARVQKLGHSVTTVVPGKAYEQLGPGAFQLRPSERTDYATLVRHLGEADEIPGLVIHGWSLSRDSTVGPTWMPSLDSSFVSIVYLTQALTDSSSLATTQILVMTSGVHGLLEEDLVIPERASLTGVCRVIPMEYPNLETRLLDVTCPNNNAELQETVGALWREITSGTLTGVVAYRNGSRQIEDLAKVRVESESMGVTCLQSGGRYLITGGLGGIGLSLARGLAGTVGARLALVGRTSLPEAGDHERFLAERGPDDPMSQRILALRELQELGGEPVAYAADCSSQEAMEDVVGDVVRRWGAIDGVIHAAGIPGRTVVQLLSPELIAGVMGPKALGAVVLDRATAGFQLDFFALCSSLSSVLGGVAQSHYAAANASLDAFAEERQRRTGQKTISIGWDTWREVGMAVHAVLPADQRDRQERALKTAIKPSEGWSIFLRALGTDLPHLLVSTTRLKDRLATRRHQYRPHQHPQPTPSADFRKTASPHAQVPIHRVSLQGQIMAVWEEVLGIREFSPDDDFFDLGGHSLLGLRLLRELEKALGSTLPLSALSRFSTVEKMADAIRSEVGDRAPEPHQTASPQMPTGAEAKDLLAVLAATGLSPAEKALFCRCLNPSGNKEPLFWCFNAPELEARRLSDHLGPDQPLFALFSGVGVLDWHKPGTAERVAELYLQEIQKLHPQGPIRLAGNCAGGQVAVSLAFRLLELGREVERLCLMECFDPLLFHFQAPLLLLFGDQSELRIQDRFGWPEPGWEEPFHRIPEVSWIPGEHGKFFDEPNLPTLGEKVRRFFHG